MCFVSWSIGKRNNEVAANKKTSWCFLLSWPTLKEHVFGPAVETEYMPTITGLHEHRREVTLDGGGRCHPKAPSSVRVPSASPPLEGPSTRCRP